jgi:hypothetical protein
VLSFLYLCNPNILVTYLGTIQDVRRAITINWPMGQKANGEMSGKMGRKMSLIASIHPTEMSAHWGQLPFNWDSSVFAKVPNRPGFPS